MVKNNLNHVISNLIFNNTAYFFEKIMSLGQNDFRTAVQKTYLSPILYFLNKTKKNTNNERGRHFRNHDSINEDIEEFDDELMKRFFKKLVDYV